MDFNRKHVIDDIRRWLHWPKNRNALLDNQTVTMYVGPGANIKATITLAVEHHGVCEHCQAKMTDVQEELRGACDECLEEAKARLAATYEYDHDK